MRGMLTNTVVAHDVDSEILQSELERALASAFGVPHIARFTRRPSAYRTSFAIEELDVTLEDGRHLRMIWKDLHARSLIPAARGVKPRFVYNPSREIQTYRHILTRYALSTPAFYGAVIRPELERYWLFMERVEGIELYQVGDFQVWQRVARWLAGMHAQFRERTSEFGSLVPLLTYDHAFYRHWMTCAREYAAGTQSAAEIKWLAERHDKVVERLVALPSTLLHGEFYASNILVVPRAESVRVCPVDWEMAAIGPGLMDLAALIAGHWSEEEKQHLASTYYLALPPPQESSWRQVMEALDYCRLQVAVQWLGWSPDWSPPAEHAHDWLREATGLAEKLGL